MNLTAVDVLQDQLTLPDHIGDGAGIGDAAVSRVMEVTSDSIEVLLVQEVGS